MNPNCKTKVWICVLTTVHRYQGFILVYFMICVVIGKENNCPTRLQRVTQLLKMLFQAKAFPTKTMLGFMWFDKMCVVPKRYN